MQTMLLRSLAAHGYRGCVLSIAQLEDVRERLEATYRQGLFDEEFYRECLCGFAFSPPPTLPDAHSLVVVAVRQPQIRFTFRWKRGRTQIIVPPTYLHGQETDQRVQDHLTAMLEREGYHLAPAVLPKKLLAVGGGLATYGRNNLSYVAGMGSLHRLVAFYSELPCPEGPWHIPRMLERCAVCRACIRHCPTGAISPDRFLLHAERCLTFHNEKAGDIPFPAWVEAPWHNCLIGCMHCQAVCPENRALLEWIVDGATFSSEETALLAHGTPRHELPGALAKKLRRSDLLDILDLLARNLTVLLEERIG